MSKQPGKWKNWTRHCLFGVLAMVVTLSFLSPAIGQTNEDPPFEQNRHSVPSWVYDLPVPSVSLSKEDSLAQDSSDEPERRLTKEAARPDALGDSGGTVSNTEGFSSPQASGLDSSLNASIGPQNSQNLEGSNPIGSEPVQISLEPVLPLLYEDAPTSLLTSATPTRPKFQRLVKMRWFISPSDPSRSTRASVRGPSDLGHVWRYARLFNPDWQPHLLWTSLLIKIFRLF